MSVRGILIELKDFDKSFVIADTHIGHEYEFVSKGVKIPNQTSKILNEILNIYSKENFKTLIILGDVKHELPIAFETRKEVLKFVEELSNHIENVVLVMGNHDGGLDKIISKLSSRNILLIDSRGFTLTSKSNKQILFLHGNSKPRQTDLVNANVIIMGHTHPAIRLRDELGFTVKEPVFVRIEIPKKVVVKEMFGIDYEFNDNILIIILPAFNPLITGIDVVDVFSREITSFNTILKYLKLNLYTQNIEIYMLDMTYLGTLNLIQKIRSESIEEKVDWNYL